MSWHAGQKYFAATARRMCRFTGLFCCFKLREPTSSCLIFPSRLRHATPERSRCCVLNRGGDEDDTSCEAPAGADRGTLCPRRPVALCGSLLPYLPLTFLGISTLGMDRGGRFRQPAGNQRVVEGDPCILYILKGFRLHGTFFRKIFQAFAEGFRLFQPRCQPPMG